MQTAIAQYFKKMKDFDLRKYLAENKLVKENINLEDALDKFENDESDSSAQPSIEGITVIRKFIDFLRERNYNETELDIAFDEYTDEIRPPFNTHTDIQNFIDYYRAENKLVKENRALYDKVVGNNFERGNKEMSFDYERDMVHKVIDGVRNDFSNDEMLTREYINTIIAALEELKVNDF